LSFEFGIVSPELRPATPNFLPEFPGPVLHQGRVLLDSASLYPGYGSARLSSLGAVKK
jgi:hypothetical protein